MITRMSTGDLAGIGSGFGTTNGLHIQFPLVKGFPATLARQIGVQLSLGFREGVLGFLPGAASSFIRILHFFHELLDLGAQARMRFAPAILLRRRFISCFDLFAPVGFRRSIQLVQGRIGCVGHFSYCALAKQPGEDRPIHRFGHQRPGFFEFGKLSHGEKNIISQEQKVQWGRRLQRKKFAELIYA